MTDKRAHACHEFLAQVGRMTVSAHMKSSTNIFVAMGCVLLGTFGAFAQGVLVDKIDFYSGVYGSLISIDEYFYDGQHALGLGPTGGDATFYCAVLPDPSSLRAYLVSSNDPISLSTVYNKSYPELNYKGDYVFEPGVPFYVGIYTGTLPLVDPLPDPLWYFEPYFGWVELVNNDGRLQMLGSALEFGGVGIYAGTYDIINVPEPSDLGLSSIAALALGWWFRRASNQTHRSRYLVRRFEEWGHA